MPETLFINLDAMIKDFIREKDDIKFKNTLYEAILDVIEFSKPRVDLEKKK
ncbi:MAG: hypothetical protein ACE5KT_06870 [Methanosarcinales archaeon]